jgi:hypothetical protein
MTDQIEAGVQAPAAVVQGSDGQATATTETQVATTETQAEETRTIPLTVLTKVRGELSSEKQARAELQQKVEQLTAAQRMMQQGQQPAQQQPAQAVDPLDGLADDEIVSVKDLRKLVQNFNPNKAVQGAITPLTQTIAKLQAQVQDPNYETTIRTYLPEMLNTNPGLQDMIKSAPNQIAAMLSIAKMSPRYLQAQQQAAQPATEQAAPDALSELQKIIENATKPGSPGSQGGGGAISGTDRFRKMSDADFDQEVARVLAGANR